MEKSKAWKIVFFVFSPLGIALSVLIIVLPYVYVFAWAMTRTVLLIIGMALLVVSAVLQTVAFLIQPGMLDRLADNSVSTRFKIMFYGGLAAVVVVSFLSFISMWFLIGIIPCYCCVFAGAVLEMGAKEVMPYFFVLCWLLGTYVFFDSCSSIALNADKFPSGMDAYKGYLYLSTSEDTATLCGFDKISPEAYTFPASINGKTVTAIFDGVFTDCEDIKTVNYNVINASPCSPFANAGDEALTVNIGDEVESIPDNLFASAKLAEVSFSSDSKCVRIGENAFSKSSLTEITLPKNLARLGYGAFKDCAYLVKVTLNGELVEISPEAFLGCGLVEITIPSNIKSIDGLAFSGCRSLTKISLPNTLDSIGNGAFENCVALTQIVYDGTCEQWNNLSKGTAWDSGIASYSVQCTDGSIDGGALNASAKAYLYSTASAAISVARL